MENLYVGVLGELFNGDGMQVIRKLVNLELERIRRERLYDLYLESRRPRYKRKNSKKKTFRKGR